MRVQSKRVIVLLFANGLLACPAIAWGPLAHYQSVVSYRPAQNLPDLWISRQPIPFGYSAIGVEVAEYFAWSHGCRRSGVVSAAPDWLLELAAWQIAFIDVVYPAEPTPHGVPQGVEEPEEDMKEIINSKLLISNYSANELALMKKTARGFAGHNAADSVVHFTYFKGDSIDGWIAEHKIKESWAELAVFENILGGYWDADGNPVAPYSMSSEGHAGIINLAQKAYRKNGQTVDDEHWPPCGAIGVESASDIPSRLAEQNGDLVGAFGAYGDFHETWWQQYQIFAAERGWYIGGSDGVLAKHAEAGNAATFAMNLMP
jgi:hypothetical protein